MTNRVMEKTSRVKYIDGLRGLAIVAVVIHHFGLETDFCSGTLFSPFFAFVINYGWAGVEVFFFLSGMMIGKKYVFQKLSSISLFEFLWGRVKMIYPYLIVNLLIAVYLNPSVNMLQVFRTLLFLHTGLIQNPSDGLYQWDIGGATWFLGPLVFCYALYYLINKYSDKDSYEKRLLMYILLAIVGMICVEEYLQYAVLNIYIGRGLIGFFSGVIYEQSVKNILSKIKDYAVVVISIIVCGCFLSSFHFAGGVNCTPNIVVDWIFLPSVLVICERVLVIRECIGNVIFAMVGKNSLPIYLLHIPILRLMKMCFKNQGLSIINEVHLVGYAIALIVLSFLISVMINKYWGRLIELLMKV